MIDPIIEEVRRVRDTHAARFHYDLDAIFQDIQERDRRSGLRFVDGVARQSAPTQVPQSNGATNSMSQSSQVTEIEQRQLDASPSGSVTNEFDTRIATATTESN